MNIQQVATGFAKGYNPVQYCWPNAQNPFEWDEFWHYAQQNPLTHQIVSLARAKILQALLDIGSKSKKPELLKWKNQAFAWLFSDQSDFRAFCSDAGFSPKIVRRKAQEIMAHGLNWRREAGTGLRWQEMQLKKLAA